MRLLVVTQAVDLDDPVLGFFHGWIKEFAKHADRVHAVCLKEGRHELPAAVGVHSLGKEYGASRLAYILRFYRYVWALRKEYDAVFVHMNQEYVVLAGLLWRLLGKRVVLWRNHKSGNWVTRLAGLLSHAVCYTSPAAYVATFRNATRMPIGIDTGAFTPGKPILGSILFLGRLDPVKRADVFLEALELLEKDGVNVRADIYGDPTPGHEVYADALRRRYARLPGVSFHGAVRNSATPDIYRSHDIYVNLTPSGSFDKTIGEAMASGCIVVCANEALREALPAALLVESGDTASVARVIGSALKVSQDGRKSAQDKARAYVEREHSLVLLAGKLVGTLKS